jgi:hypothetical protein
VVKKPTLSLVQSTPTDPAAPRTLGEPGRKLWNAVQSEYRIDDIGGTEILAQICCAADRVEQLAGQIAIDGPTIMSKTGLREHPALKAELALRAFICRNLQRLGLNLETIKPVGRPPGPGYRGD